MEFSWFHVRKRLDKRNTFVQFNFYLLYVFFLYAFCLLCFLWNDKTRLIIREDIYHCWWWGWSRWIAYYTRKHTIQYLNQKDKLGKVEFVIITNSNIPHLRTITGGFLFTFYIYIFNTFTLYIVPRWYSIIDFLHQKHTTGLLLIWYNYFQCVNGLVMVVIL